MWLAYSREQVAGRQSEAGPQRERDQQSARRYQGSGVAAAAQRPEIDLITHGEHEDDYSKLRRD
jgi:hypothetical protein